MIFCGIVITGYPDKKKKIVDRVKKVNKQSRKSIYSFSQSTRYTQSVKIKTFVRSIRLPRSVKNVHDAFFFFLYTYTEQS